MMKVCFSGFISKFSAFWVKGLRSCDERLLTWVYQDDDEEKQTTAVAKSTAASTLVTVTVSAPTSTPAAARGEDGEVFP